jgi:hypothetical protein
MTVPRPPLRTRFPQFLTATDLLSNGLSINNVYIAHGLTMLQSFGFGMYVKPIMVFVAMSWYVTVL